MTDDELIERLRRTLQTEAAAIAPNPADQPAAPYTVPAPVHRSCAGAGRSPSQPPPPRSPPA